MCLLRLATSAAASSRMGSPALTRGPCGCGKGCGNPASPVSEFMGPDMRPTFTGRSAELAVSRAACLCTGEPMAASAASDSRRLFPPGPGGDWERCGWPGLPGVCVLTAAPRCRAACVGFGRTSCGRSPRLPACFATLVSVCANPAWRIVLSYWRSHLSRDRCAGMVSHVAQAPVQH